MLIHTCLYPGTKGDYFRHHPKQLRGGQATSNWFLTKSSTNEWCVLLFEYLDFVGLIYLVSGHHARTGAADRGRRPRGAREG